MLYLHTDSECRPDQWYRRFEYLFRQRRLSYKKVNLYRRNYRRLKAKEGDALIGRFGHKRRHLARMKPIYSQLAAHFGDRIFPSRQTYEIYDDKRRQADLIEQHAYPTPATAVVSSQEDVERFLAQTGLRFPLVTKRSSGAGSANVRLAHDLDEVFMPGIVQEYCAGNDRDLRLNVIGDRVMGFERLNRPGDFRASGGGQLVYPEHIDQECLDLVYRISQDQQFDSMSYDLVKDDSGRWVVLEMSYAYVDACVRDCSFYYDMRTGVKTAKPGTYPQDYILDDFLEKHPVVESHSKQAAHSAGLIRRWRRRKHQPSQAGDGQIAYEQNDEIGAINIELKEDRLENGEVFEWPNIVELNKLGAQFSDGKRVLDIGCGTGCAAYAMAANAESVLAIEPDGATVAWARANRSAPNLEYRTALSSDLEDNQQFDLITNIDVIEHVKDYLGLVVDFVRLLKPDGTLLLTTPNRNRDNPPALRPLYPYHVQEFSASDLYFIFNMLFDEVQLKSLTNPNDHKTLYPIDVNSRATPVIVIARRPKTAALARLVHLAGPGDPEKADGLPVREVA